MSEFENIWSDINPIPQDDGPDPVVKIAYTNEFTQLMDIFRAVLRSKEYSLRTLNLTKQLLDINPANYTIWQFRRECLVHLKVNVSDELDYMDTFSRENPKNYQIWHHRRTIVNKLDSIDNGFRELNFCNNVFDVDAKNYHAWVHRQWVVLRFQIWDQELEFIEKCLIEDIRNNSAWNHRWFCIHKGPEPITEKVLYREFNFCFDSINRISLNESAWNYLRGLASFHKKILSTSIQEKCLKVVEESNYTNIYAISLLADLNEIDGIDNNLITSLQVAQKLLTIMINLDTIRAKSWTRRALSVKHLICNLVNASL